MTHVGKKSLMMKPLRDNPLSQCTPIRLPPQSAPLPLIQPQSILSNNRIVVSSSSSSSVSSSSDEIITKEDDKAHPPILEITKPSDAVPMLVTKSPQAHQVNDTHLVSYLVNLYPPTLFDSLLNCAEIGTRSETSDFATKSLFDNAVKKSLFSPSKSKKKRKRMMMPVIQNKDEGNKKHAMTRALRMTQKQCQILGNMYLESFKIQLDRLEEYASRNLFDFTDGTKKRAMDDMVIRADMNHLVAASAVEKNVCAASRENQLDVFKHDGENVMSHEIRTPSSNEISLLTNISREDHEKLDEELKMLRRALAQSRLELERCREMRVVLQRRKRAKLRIK